MNAVRFRLAVDELNRLLPNGIQKPILDAGCGGGWVLAELSKLGWEMHGCDISTEMLKETREYLTINGCDPNITLVNTKVDDLSAFPSNSLGGVLALGVLYYLEDESKALREFHRVLAPGGVLIVSQQNAFFHTMTFNKYTIEFVRRHIFPTLDLSKEDETELIQNYRNLLVNPEEPKNELVGSARGVIHMRDEIPLQYHEKVEHHGFDAVGAPLYHGFHGVPPLLREVLGSRYEELSSDVDYAKRKDPLAILLASHFLQSFRKREEN